MSKAKKSGKKAVKKSVKSNKALTSSKSFDYSNDNNHKLVIYLSGGVIQECYTNIGMGGLDFVLIDVDNLEAEGYSSDAIDELLDKETEGLKGIYPDCPSPENDPNRDPELKKQCDEYENGKS